MGSRTKPSRLTALLLILGGLLAGTHLAATLAFTGPETPLRQSLQPGLNKYFLGPLDQGWNLFAPGPYSQDSYMLIRACISPAEVCARGAAAGAQFTEWRNLTAEEMKPIRYNIFANRETRQTRAIHGRFWSAAQELNASERAMAEASHLNEDPVFGVDLNAPEATDRFSPTGVRTLRAYQRLEDTAVGLGSLYAYSLWGDKATLVEVRMRRNPVTPFAQRHNSTKDERPASWVNIGWRSVMTFDEATRAAWR